MLKKNVVVKRLYAGALRFFFLFVCSFSASVVADSEVWPWISQVEVSESVSKSNSAKIQYLGTGGVLIEYANKAVLADPFFSNPSITDLLLLKDLKPKHDAIKQYLPNTENVKGLLIGHGHYDHLMDVPFIVDLMPENAKLYGSKTAMNQVASVVPKDRLIALNSKTVDYSTKKIDWEYLQPDLRFMAILAEHAPHVGGYLFAGGVVDEPMESLPENVMDWQCGETLGYVIEWLEKEKVAFRALYLSSSSGFPLGVPPKKYASEILNTQPAFDIALLSVANFDAVDLYPSELLKNAQPNAVMMLHWERFWKAYKPGDEQAIKTSEVDRFIAQAKQSSPKSKLYLPRRLDVLILPVEVKSE